MNADVGPIEFRVQPLRGGQLFALSDILQFLLQRRNVGFRQRPQVPYPKTEGARFVITLQNGMEAVSPTISHHLWLAKMSSQARTRRISNMQFKFRDRRLIKEDRAFNIVTWALAKA
jgi:hypothetical protein